MNKKFTVELCSDLDYHEMVMDISFENQTLGMITQENGPDNMVIEIFSPKNEAKSWILPLNDFIETLLFAKKRLAEKKPDN